MARTRRQKTRGRRRRSTGATVNPQIPLPASPAPKLITAEGCEICGETPREWSAGVDYGDGVALLRQAARREGDKGGGYRSRGPVLWAMHVVKIGRFYERHMACLGFAGSSLPPDLVWL